MRREVIRGSLLNIAVIGGGAAGFFAAIQCASRFPEHTIVIFEKSGKVLSKVRVSGGGRCNVTHDCRENDRLVENYPRGRKELRSAFSRFNVSDTIAWFGSYGVTLKVEADGRMFPVTDNSETVIRCLTDAALKAGVRVELNQSVKNINPKSNSRFDIQFESGAQGTFDRIVIATGGSPSPTSYGWISSLGHTIISPVPSLFTFNIPGSPLKGLEGISQNVTVALEGFKDSFEGPLLITHWGISGPAVLKLSAFAARWLNERSYSVDCLVNWLPGMKEEQARSFLLSHKETHRAKKIYSIPPPGITGRLWQRLCLLSDIGENERFGDAGKVKMGKLLENCIRMKLQMKGKTTFKEEFVTCGGVSLKEVNMLTMESLKSPGIYFAGEVLDIDGITGGFNFQAAWTTGFLSGMNAGKQGL